MSFYSQIFREAVVKPIDLWEIALCNPQKNVLNSIEFMQKLTVLAISNITYLHNIFPESAYSTRNLSEIEIKILQGSDELPIVQKMMSFIRSALGAMAMKYLHKMIFVIEELDVDNKEVYTLNFSYNESMDDHENENDDTVTISQSQKLDTPDIIKKQAEDLLRKLNILIKNKKFESSKITMHFRLVLHEDIPEDFQLEFFHECDEIPGIDLPGSSCKLKLGKVTTSFHALTIRNHNAIEMESAQNNENVTTEDNSTFQIVSDMSAEEKPKQKKRKLFAVEKLDERTSKRRRFPRNCK